MHPMVMGVVFVETSIHTDSKSGLVVVVSRVWGSVL